MASVSVQPRETMSCNPNCLPGWSSKNALSLLELSNSSLSSFARASFTTALVMERAMSSPLYLSASTEALVR